MHATFHRQLTEGDDCKRITLSAGQYARLVAFIRDGFAFDAEGRTTHIGAHADYGLDDAFYDGVGRYNLFHTCNTWTNDALKARGTSKPRTDGTSAYRSCQPRRDERKLPVGN